MEFVEDEIREILAKKPSECAYLDYKIVPYTTKSKHDFIKDVIAMLNSEESIGKDKYIIFGVEDKNKNLIGVDLGTWPDDNVFQNWVDNIEPRPQLQSGTVEFDKKTFGYVVVSKDNNDRVYEVGKTVAGDAINGKSSEKAGAYRGQAYIRQGSRNSILMQSQRIRIFQQKVQNEKSIDDIYMSDPLGSEGGYTKALSVAIMIGQWNEEYEGDIRIIEDLYGGSYETFIAKIRDLHLKYSQQISISNRIWKISNRKKALESIAGNIYDEEIDLLFSCTQRIYEKINPKYELPSDQRFAYGVYRDKKQEVYSYNIIKGVAVFMAIAGNNSTIYTSCSRYKIENCIDKVIKNVFNFEDWKNYATLQEVYDYFAESYPQSFLDAMERALIEKNKGLIEYINQKETGITETFYGYHFNWTLPKLAAYPEYFAKSCHVLFLLAECREDFLNSLVGVILPWFPQTLAKSSVRIGMVKGLIKMNENLGWKLLMKLMPKKTTTGNPIQNSRFMRKIQIPEGTTNKAYWNDEEQYIYLACEFAQNDENRLIDLLEVIDDVPKDLFNVIVLTLEKNSEKISDKTIVWNSIIDLIAKHRKYKDSKWALPEEALSILEELAEIYSSGNELEQSKRLFKKEQYDLLEENGNWTENEKKLFLKQKKIVKKIYMERGLNGVLEYNKTIDRHDILGRGLSFIDIKVSEQKEVFTAAMSENEQLHEFVKGNIGSIYFNKPELFQQQISLLETDIEKAKVYSEINLSEKSVQTIRNYNASAQDFYWKNVIIYGMEELSDSSFDYVIKKLNLNTRIDEAINLLFYKCVYGKQQISVDLLIDTLNLYVLNQQRVVDAYRLQQLIEWLENNCNEKQKVVDIEWKYLNIFDEEKEPKYLQRELAANPDFFVEIICTAFKGHNEEKRILSKEEEIVANHCLKLVFSWKRMPGLTDDGTIDENELETWYSQVKDLSMQKDRYEVAMTYFGHTLFHSPKDNDGFFINRKVADIIQNDLDGSIGSGYSTEAYNSRGVHWCDPSGEAEFKIEKDYLERAESADSNGYFKLGEILRKIAKSFHSDGLHNIEEHRQWEKASDEDCE